MGILYLILIILLFICGIIASIISLAFLCISISEVIVNNGYKKDYKILETKLLLLDGVDEKIKAIESWKEEYPGASKYYCQTLTVAIDKLVNPY